MLRAHSGTEKARTSSGRPATGSLTCTHKPGWSETSGDGVPMQHGREAFDAWLHRTT